MNRSQGAVLAIGTALSSLGMGLLIPVLPTYAASLGASGTQIGLLLAGLGLARLLVALPAAGLTLRLGHRRLLIASAALTVPAALTCAVAGGFWTLTLFCFVEGGTAGVFSTVGTAAVMAGRSSSHRGRSLATYQSAGLVGISLGAGIGGLVAQQLGARMVFLLYAALTAVVALWLRRALAPTPAAALAEPERKDETPRQRFRALVGSPALLPLWLLVFAFMFTRTGTQLIAAPLLGARQLGLSPAAIGFALMLGGFGALGMLYPSGWLTDRYGEKWTLVGGGLGMAVSLVLLSASNNYGVFIAAALLLGVATGLTGPGPAAFLAAAVPERERPLAAGRFRMVGDTGAMLAPPLFGGLADRAGYGSVLLGAAFVPLVALLVFLWYARPRATQRPAAAPRRPDRASLVSAGERGLYADMPGSGDEPGVSVANSAGTEGRPQ